MTERVGEQRLSIRRCVGTALGATLLVVAVSYVAAHWQDVARELTLRPRWLAAAVAGEVALACLRAATLREACRTFGVQLGRVEAAALVSWANLANYVVTAAGGIGIRAAYLRRRHGLDLAGFASLLTTLYAVQFLLLALAGSAATWWSRGDLGRDATLSLLLLFGLVCAASATLLAWPFRPPAGEVFLARTVRRVVEGWRLLSATSLTRLLCWLLLYVVVGWGLTATYFELLGWSLEADQALLLSALSEVSVLGAVTPGGLGILESALALGARLAGAPLAVGLAVAGLRRLVTILVSAALASLRTPWSRHPENGRAGTA